MTRGLLKQFVMCASLACAESYDLDFKTSQKFSGKEEKTNFFINVKSATESGWDFSSRW